MRIKITTKCFQNITRSFFHFKIKHMVLQYKQEVQNMNHEKPLLYHVFQLKFGQVYSAHLPNHLWYGPSFSEMLVQRWTAQKG